MLDASRQMEQQEEESEGSDGINSVTGKEGEEGTYLHKAIESYSNCIERFPLWHNSTRARSVVVQQPSSTEEKCM